MEDKLLLTIKRIKNDWLKEFLPAINKIDTPKIVYDRAYSTQINSTCNMDGYDDIHCDSLFKSIKRAPTN